MFHSDLREESDRMRKGFCANMYSLRGVTKCRRSPEAASTHPGDKGMKEIADRIISALKLQN